MRISSCRGAVNETCRRMAQLSCEFYASGATSSNKKFTDSKKDTARKCIDVVNALGDVSSMIESIEKEFVHVPKKTTKAISPPGPSEISACLK